MSKLRILKLTLSKKQLFLSVFSGLLLFLNAAAECPSSITFGNHTVTTSTCQHNGSITVNSNVGTEAFYQIIEGPTGYPTGVQSGKEFLNLYPGNYKIKVTCGTAVATTATISVPGTYVPLTNFVINWNDCPVPGSYATLTVSAITGGSGPYTYGVAQSNDINANESLFTYSNNPVINFPDGKTYQVRVKDVCGGYITKTIVPEKPTYVITPPQQSLMCGSSLTIRNLYWTIAPNTVVAKSTLEVYAGGSSVTPATGALVYTYAPSNNYVTSTTFTATVPTGSTHIYIRFLDPCGNEAGHLLYPISNLQPVVERGVIYFGSVKQCDPLTDPNQEMMMSVSWLNSIEPEILHAYVTGYDGPDATGNIVIPEKEVTRKGPGYFYLMNGYATSFKIRIVTPCGEFTTIVNSPELEKWSVNLAQSPVYCPVPDPDNVNVKLNVVYAFPGAVYTIVKNPDDGTSYKYTNGTTIKLPPGNYTLIATGGPNGCSKRFDFTVITMPMIDKMPAITLKTTVIQSCYAESAKIGYSFTAFIPKSDGVQVESPQYSFRKVGAGSVLEYGIIQVPAATYKYNKEFSYTRAPYTPGFSGTTLTAGKYVVTISMPCEMCCDSKYFSVSDTVEVFGGSSIKIAKQLAMNCDNNSTASVYFELDGVPPFKIERRPVGSSNYTTLETSWANNYYLDQNGLSANTAYEYRFSNNCGAAVTTTAVTAYIAKFQKITSVNP